MLAHGLYISRSRRQDLNELPEVLSTPSVKVYGRTEFLLSYIMDAWANVVHQKGRKCPSASHSLGYVMAESRLDLRNGLAATKYFHKCSRLYQLLRLRPRLVVRMLWRVLGKQHDDASGVGKYGRCTISHIMAQGRCRLVKWIVVSVCFYTIPSRLHVVVQYIHGARKAH